jgi:hypothetical protein
MISPIAALQKDNHATVRPRRKRELAERTG